jgi:hypothetical protein
MIHAVLPESSSDWATLEPDGQDFFMRSDVRWRDQFDTSTAQASTWISISWYNAMSHPNSTPNERTASMQAKTETWVVYLMTIRKHPGMKAVCEQTEWDAMELARPGYHHFIQGGFTSEVEAELIARGESGASKPRAWKLR